MINDTELAKALDIPIKLVAKIAPEKREMYERLIDLADRLNRGERPPGVIICE